MQENYKPTEWPSGHARTTAGGVSQTHHGSFERTDTDEGPEPINDGDQIFDQYSPGLRRETKRHAKGGGLVDYLRRTFLGK